MCIYCENHEDYYEGSLVKAKISLGFGGEEYIWLLVDPDTKKLGMVVLNQKTAEQIDYFRDIYFCPMCGKRLKK